MKIFPKRNKILIILIGILILIFLNFYQTEVRSFFYNFSETIQKFLWKSGQKISDVLETISEFKNLKKETELLKLKNQELLAEISFLKELKKENEILREALNIGLQKEFKLTLAQVIGKDILQDSILIDKGSEDGISEGMAIISKSKIFLGKIGKVYKNHSEIILISNKESKISVKVENKEIEGIIKGKGNFKILLDLISLDKEIKSGDLIVTTGGEGNFPKGLLVGKVDKVLRSDILPHQQAEVLPFFEIKDLELVFVILNF